jgi:hypothetical protein
MKWTSDMGLAQTILTEELQMRWVHATFVLRLLTDYQVKCFKMIANGLFDKSTQDVVSLGKFATGDESQLFAYDPETK